MVKKFFLLAILAGVIAFASACGNGDGDGPVILTQPENSPL